MMKKINFRKIVFGVLIVVVFIFIVLATIGTIHINTVEKTERAVAKIHATKLTLEDVMGDNLPPDPGYEADKTIQGIDINNNGIRDDVEIAIFKKYADSARTRAVLLQYALVLQTEVLQSVLNKTIVTKIITEEGRAQTCLSDTLVPRKNPETSRSYEDMEKIKSYISFVETKQFNTSMRKNNQEVFYKYLGSFSDSDNISCDINFDDLVD